MRERRDAKKKQQQEAVENKLRRVQLRESSHALKSELLGGGRGGGEENDGCNVKGVGKCFVIKIKLFYSAK